MVCATCGKSFTGQRKDAKYCSPGCRYTKHNVTKKRINLPRDLRFAVLMRDGFRCVYCGKAAPDGKQLVVDHVQSIDDGGALTDMRNLAAACLECNSGKGHRSVNPKDVPALSV